MKKRNNTAAENAVRAKAPCTLDQETRDLLTRAASAVGIRIVEWVGDQANVEKDGGHYGWNPLASWGKGEALALAVKLRLGLIPLEGGGWDVERFDHNGNGTTLASCANSGAWALQEAIVQAASKCERPVITYGVAPSQAPSDGFNGDTPHLINCMRALVNLNDAGALVPHGIGGHARTLLLAAAARLERALGVDLPDGGQRG